MRSVSNAFRVGWIFFGSFVAACSSDDVTTKVLSSRNQSHTLFTAEDSAAAIKAAAVNQYSLSTASSTSITLNAGEKVVITIVSTECSGNPETITAYGVINQLVASGPCASLVGTTVTLGPATATGSLSLRATHQTYGEGPSGQVTGESPDFTVGMNDGYPGDVDYNDVIATVHIVCPTLGDAVLDHPSFASRYDSLMKVSNVTDPNPDNHREWSMWIYSDSSGLQIEWPHYTQFDPCGVVAGPADSTKLVYAKMHSHAFAEGADISRCGQLEPYDPRANGGSHDDDWDIAVQLGEYVVSPNFVARLIPGTPKTDRPFNQNMWERNSNKCWNKAQP